MSGYIITALEDTYGTAPATGWQSDGIPEDKIKTKPPQELANNVLQKGLATEAYDGRRLIDKGGEGTLPLRVASSGIGKYLRCAASTTAVALVDGSSLAVEEVYGWTPKGVPVDDRTSFSAEAYRERPGGDGGFDGYDTFLYIGGKVLNWKVTADLENYLMFELGLDFAPGGDRQKVDPNRTVEAITPLIRYAWPDLTVVLTPLEGGPDVTCVRGLELSTDNKLDDDDWCLQMGSTKHEPARFANLVITGTLNCKYRDPQFFDAFKSGAGYSVSLHGEGPEEIDTDIVPSIDIEVGCIVFREPNDPEAKVDGPTEQALPFVVLDLAQLDEDDNPVPVITWTQVTEDVDLITGS